MANEKNKSRRGFLKNLVKSSALVAGVPSILSASNKSKTIEIPLKAYKSINYTSNDQINIGLIGSGGMGMGDLDTALKCEGTKVIAAANHHKSGNIVRLYL